MPTASREITVPNKLGLHARPAMQFVELANKFRSGVRVTAYSDKVQEADGKSVMQMIILAATAGTRLRISADGDDAEQAVSALSNLVASGFGEEKA
jgi:phosphocarrier protein